MLTITSCHALASAHFRDQDSKLFLGENVRVCRAGFSIVSLYKYKSSSENDEQGLSIGLTEILTFCAVAARIITTYVQRRDIAENTYVSSFGLGHSDLPTEAGK
jgi:hypothetical protein